MHRISKSCFLDLTLGGYQISSNMAQCYTCQSSIPHQQGRLAPILGTFGSSSLAAVPLSKAVVR
jgi:hypothetical protein